MKRSSFESLPEARMTKSFFAARNLSAASFVAASHAALCQASFSLRISGCCQSLFAICIVMCETTFITDPYLVHFLVLPRHHTFDNEIATSFCFTTRVQCGIASHRALRTDRSRGDSNSHGRASKRKSTVVNAPTGHISVVLPEKTESKPGSENVMICMRAGTFMRSRSQSRLRSHPGNEHSARIGCSVPGQGRSIRRAARAFRDAAFHHR